MFHILALVLLKSKYLYTIFNKKVIFIQLTGQIEFYFE
jgi:hypothetical protein